MLRSKSRSGSVDLGQKNHYTSVFSRTLSASKLCRGDALGSQIDANALKFVDKRHSKVPNSSENRIDKGTMMMQRQIGELEEDLKRAKEKLDVSEYERDQALDELKGAKQEFHEANTRFNEALSPKKAKELMMELENMKALLDSSRNELKIKDKKIESLETELGRTREFEPLLAEKDASLNELRKELRDVREKEKGMLELVLDDKGRVQQLEDELEKEKESQSKMVDSFAVQTKQLEATKIELEESKIEIMSLRDKIESLEQSMNLYKKEIKDGSSSVVGENSKEEEIRGLKFELQITKENLAQSQEAETRASLKAKSLLEEMESLKNELNQAIDAEEKSKSAMDDLALALKEVATESNQAKEKEKATQIELDHVKAEAEQLKTLVQSMEEKFMKLLDEAKQEAELHKNTADRLRLEAEETLFAWNGKEMGFVSCIKRAEEEKSIAQDESLKLVEALKAAENMTRASRDETYKLRDILKQAVNEANAAKAAAGIARDENSVLKDCLAEKEEALHFITRENERLRISEAAAHENVKQLKRMLSTASMSEDEGTRKGMLSSSDSKEDRENNKMKKAFSFDLEDLKFMNEPDEKVLDEDPEKAEALKGSIFDDNAETPKSEPHTPKSSAVSHQRRNSSPFLDSVGTPNSKDFDHVEGASPYDSDGEKHSSRKMKTMFRRVGDMLMIRKGFHIH